MELITYYTCVECDQHYVYSPFAYDRSGVRLHAPDFADLDPHRTGGGDIQEAGHIEINGHILDTLTPGRSLPMEDDAGMIVADSPLF